MYGIPSSHSPLACTSSSRKIAYMNQPVQKVSCYTSVLNATSFAFIPPRRGGARRNGHSNSMRH